MATFIAISYPTLQQDPNVTTQSILTQISQQLAHTNSSSLAASPSTTFSPSASVVFINSVWFLSLVLSLTCALMATLMQQWARRYLQIIQRNHAPHVRAHLREYFSRGAEKFSIFGLVELLPSLLLLSVLLFFAGLVVFAYLANHIVAYITIAIVGFCSLSYIALTLMPLIFQDCPYYTPLTSVLWFSAQIIVRAYSSVLHRVTKQLYQRWGTVSERTFFSCRDRHEKMAKSWSEDVISRLAKSATKNISMDIYKKALVWTLQQLNQDHELEDFVSGVPGLYESEAFITPDNKDVQRNIRPVLAVLPGPTSSNAPLPWSIIRLAQRAMASNLSKPIQQKRTQACLRALYYIPGAIRDVLASYAAGKHYCLELLPLLNSPESLEIIDELWNTPNDDVALSVRCAAAVVAAFMITPPHLTLDTFVIPVVGFIGNDKTGKQFLNTRLRLDSNANGGVAPESDLRSDSARLQNIVRFLTDIKDTLQYMNTQWWASDEAESIRQERRALSRARHMEDYCNGRGMFDQQRNQVSPAFVAAAQQDLITLTLETLARDSVANAATSQREAFQNITAQLGQVVATQARTQAQIRAGELPEREGFELLALGPLQVVDRNEMVKDPLEPVLQSLLLPQSAAMPTPQLDDRSPIQMPVPSPAPVETVPTNETLGPAGVGTLHRQQPLRTHTPPTLIMSEYSTSSSAGLATAVRELGDPSSWGARPPVPE